MRAHKIRNEILLFSDFPVDIVKLFRKFFIYSAARLSHMRKHVFAYMLRCDLELTAYVILQKLPKKRIVLIRHNIVVSQSRTDKNLLYSVERAELS